MSDGPADQGDQGAGGGLAEEALREKEARLRAALELADRRKDEFLAVLGHELRNPLAALGLALRLEEARAGAGGAGARHLAVMRRQLGSLHRLVDDLLDLTRITRGKVGLRLAPVDLADVARAEVAVHAQAEAGRLRIELRAPDGPVWVRGDAQRIAQVVQNLVHNACKFSEAGGLVEVEVVAGPGGPALTVRDHGVGMAPELMAGLFQPFRQADHGPERGRGGLGLGLSLVKGLVERMGGEVIAASDGPGRGATFRVRLPASGPPAEAPAPPPGTAARRGRPLRVVVVDDDPDVRASLVEYLAALRGHQVAPAGDCEAALEEARRLGAEALLCDVGLPGASGLELARRARQDPALRGALLLALTGYGSDADRARSLEAGFDAHLTKPVDLEALDRLLEAHALRGRPAPSLHGQAAAPDPQE